MPTSLLAESFRGLGEHVEAVYRRQNYNGGDLPAIAEDALANWNDGFAFDVHAITEFLATTSIAQQPSPRGSVICRLRFSNNGSSTLKSLCGPDPQRRFMNTDSPVLSGCCKGRVFTAPLGSNRGG